MSFAQYLFHQPARETGLAMAQAPRGSSLVGTCRPVHDRVYDQQRRKHARYNVSKPDER